MDKNGAKKVIRYNENAIAYLQRKGKIRQDTRIIEEKVVPKKVVIQEKVKKVVTYQHPKSWTPAEKKEIEKYNKQGRIYGDPMIDVEF